MPANASSARTPHLAKRNEAHLHSAQLRYVAQMRATPQPTHRKPSYRGDVGRVARLGELPPRRRASPLASARRRAARDASRRHRFAATDDEPVDPAKCASLGAANPSAHVHALWPPTPYFTPTPGPSSTPSLFAGPAKRPPTTPIQNSHVRGDGRRARGSVSRHFRSCSDCGARAERRPHWFQVTGDSNPLPPTTGINHYWDYTETPIGGVGRYLVNTGTGNLLVQADDMAIPHKGVGLAFRRTYNSQSYHDYERRDNSQPSNYGEGWTNNWDAHIAWIGD